MDGSTYEDAKGVSSGIFSFPAFELFQQKLGSVFASLFAYYPTASLNVIVERQADVVRGEYDSGDYFRGLAVSPAADRLIVPDDDRAGVPPVAVEDGSGVQPMLRANRS
jgi:hypothetical protein